MVTHARQTRNSTCGNVDRWIDFSVYLGCWLCQFIKYKIKKEKCNLLYETWRGFNSIPILTCVLSKLVMKFILKLYIYMVLLVVFFKNKYLEVQSFWKLLITLLHGGLFFLCPLGLHVCSLWLFAMIFPTSCFDICNLFISYCVTSRSPLQLNELFSGL